MTATPTLHSVSTTRRSDALHALAEQLYGLISSGHDALAYNVDPRGPALTVIDGDGKRRPVQPAAGAGADVPPWQRARELREGGVEVDRRFNAWVLERHLRGRYSVAPAAAGWVQWVALDIDAHPAAGSPELVARRLAKAGADRVLAGVWRALNCSAERHPLVLRSPGGGYHVWFPLTRGSTSTNPEHTWPALVARAWFERHLLAAGLELAPGVLEVFPSGRCLRAPCGLGMQVLQATRPDDPDALGLVPWPGTMASARVDWLGQRPALSSPVRRVVPMVRAFVGQWDAQRRTLAEWLGRPEAAWDPAWGFLGWRDDKGREISPGEKNSGGASAPEDGRSQQSDDVPGRPLAGGIQVAEERQEGQGAPGGRSGSPVEGEDGTPSAPEVDVPLDLAGARLVRGRDFKVKVRRLLCEGITQPSTRHDAVLTLVFYWGATCGLSGEMVLARLEAWCRAHPHNGSKLNPRAFVATCLREGRHYFEHYAPLWPFRGRGDAGGLGTLTSADQPVLAAIDPRVRDEAAALLAWLAGRADGEGRVGEPSQIATGLLARLCGDRRVDDAGKRRRATALALAELERLGVLTLAAEYRVGHHGRSWSCWYRFGSGELPRVVALPAADWAALEQPSTVATVPTLAIVPSSAPLEDAAVVPVVEVRVVGERVVPEGLLRVLTDGARGRARTLLTLASDVGRPTAAPAARAPWFVRAFQAHAFTPAELWSANAATVIAFPDVEARRRMTRRERIALGGGGTGGGGAASAPVIPLRDDDGAATGGLGTDVAGSLANEAGPAAELRSGVEPSGPIAAAPIATIDSPPSLVAAAPPGRADGTAAPDAARSVEEMRAELAAEVGDAIAAAMPLELLEIACRAWGKFRGRGS